MWVWQRVNCVVKGQLQPCLKHAGTTLGQYNRQRRRQRRRDSRDAVLSETVEGFFGVYIRKGARSFGGIAEERNQILHRIYIFGEHS